MRAIGVNGPQLLDARQHLDVVILDALFPTLELRVGVGDGAELVTITRGKGLAHDYLPRRRRGLPGVASRGTPSCQENPMTTATYTIPQQAPM